MGCRESISGVRQVDFRTRAAATLPDSFTYVSSVRVLPDESFIVSDPREGRVELHTIGAAVSPVARQGFGPDEWSRAVALHPSGANESVQYDPASRRLHFYSGAHLTHVAPPDSTPTPSASFLGASDDGWLYFLVPPTPSSDFDSRIAFRDSLAVVRTETRSLLSDTIAMLRDAPGSVVVRTDTDGNSVPIALARPAFATGEQAAPFVDGWLAVLRLAPYRIDWRRPDGSWQLGKALRPAGRRLTTALKEEYLRQNAGLIDRLHAAPEDVRAALMARFTTFPKQLEIVGTNALSAGYDGRLYVEHRAFASDSARRYQVIDRSDAECASLVFPFSERLITATESHLYVVRTDASGVQQIRRYPQPPEPC